MHETSHIHHKSIDEFRTPQNRVFRAAPYFNVDLEYEIQWHKEHIATLQKHLEDPDSFHSQFTDGEIDEHRKRHYQEHVVDSIPFHTRLMHEEEHRLKTILEMIPKRKYEKIREISQKFGGTPEYFVYDTQAKKLFFVVERLNDEKRNWIYLVRDKHKLADVVVLDH